MQPKDQAQKRGLAGAVGAEQPEHATRFDAQRHVIDGDLAILVNLGELVGLNHQILGTLGHEAPSSTGTIMPKKGDGTLIPLLALDHDHKLQGSRPLFWAQARNYTCGRNAFLGQPLE